MELLVELLNISTGGNRIALLSDSTANQLGVHSSDRIKIAYGTREMIAITNIAQHYPNNRIGIFQETQVALEGIKNDEPVQVHLAPLPESLFNIRSKLHGERLREKDINAIVKDVVERHLSSVEIAGFLTALSIHGLSTGEAEALTRAMIDTGKTIDFGPGPILCWVGEPSGIEHIFVVIHHQRGDVTRQPPQLSALLQFLHRGIIEVGHIEALVGIGQRL